MILSQLIAFSVMAACVDSNSELVKVNNSLADKTYCCKNYAQYNTDLCSSNSSSGSSVNLDNPLGTATVPSLIGNIINALLGIVGSLALVMFIYGGFTWMLASGNETAVEKGKKILVWATIGLVVIFASYSLLHFILSAVTSGSAS